MTFDLGNPIIVLFVTVGILIGLKYVFKAYYNEQDRKKNKAIEDHRLNLDEKTLPKGFKQQNLREDKQ